MQRHPKRVFCVRHGESTGNLGGAEWINPPLTPRGRLQARRLQEALKHISFDHAYISPLDRARDSFAESGLYAAQMHLDSRITEYTPDPQDYASMVPYTDYLEGVKDDAHNAWLVPYRERVPAFLNDLIALPAHNVLVMAHGGFLSTLLQYFLAANCEDYRDSIPHNCGIGVIEIGTTPRTDRLLVWNDVRHLTGVLSQEPLSAFDDSVKA